MNRIVLAFTVMAVLGASAATAFGQGATTSLYGKWKFDRVATIAAVMEVNGRGEEVDDELPKDFSATLEFTTEHRLHIESRTLPDGPDAADTQSGKWKVLVEKPGKVDLELKMEEGGPETGTLIVEFVDKDTIRLVVKEDDQLLVFRRMTAKE